MREFKNNGKNSQGINDMFEIPEETKSEYHKLAELRKQREAGKKRLANLSDELRVALNTAEEKTQELKSLQKAYAVSEREIKDYQNDIFLLDKQCSDIVESSALLEAEYQKREKQLIDLESEKIRKTGLITEIIAACRDLPSTLIGLEKEIQNLTVEMEERRVVKQDLSDEIARALSKTSVDRDAVEALMMDLNNTFMETIDRKNEVQAHLSETESSIQEITATIRNLEQQVVVLGEVKSLQNQRSSITTELNENKETLRVIDADYKETNRRLQDTKDRLDAAIQENENLLAEIAFLEKDVSQYDELVTLRAIAQTELDQCSQENKRQLDELFEIFTASLKLNEAILLARGHVQSMDEIG